jgi:hypothetical protein
MATTDVLFESLTRDELRDELDRLAQEKLGLSADEFIARYRAGELDLDSPAVLRIAVLARLLNDSE